MSGCDKRDAWVAELGADAIERFLPDGRVMIDVSELPGLKGIQVKGRLTPKQMKFLTQEYGVEFALTYKYGLGPNGGGGTYWLYSGIQNKVHIPLDSETMLIYHTHPAGYLPTPSKTDQKLMDFMISTGSPQHVSTIIPETKDYMVNFTSSTFWKIFENH